MRLDVYGSHSPAGEVLARFKSNVRGQIAVRERLTNKQIAEGLSTASVFLFPTQYEGFGMALAEAMACGCAAVTTPTGFGAELRDGLEAIVCGYDDTSAMRRAVCALLNDDHLRSRISKAARNRVSTLTWTSQIAKLAAVYQAWLHGDSAVRIRRADA